MKGVFHSDADAAADPQPGGEEIIFMPLHALLENGFSKSKKKGPMPSNESISIRGRHGLDILFCKMNTIGNVAGDVTQFQLEIEKDTVKSRTEGFQPRFSSHFPKSVFTRIMMSTSLWGLSS